MTDSHALVALFEAHRDEITVEPIGRRPLLRALTLSTTHPMLADEPMPPDEIAPLFLHGVRAEAAVLIAPPALAPRALQAATLAADRRAADRADRPPR